MVAEYVRHASGREKDASIIWTCHKASNSNQAGAHRSGCDIWVCSVFRKKDLTIAWNYLMGGGI